MKRSTLVIQEAQNTPLSTQAATVPATAPAPKSSSSTSSDGQHEPRRSRTHSNSNWIPGPQSLLPLNSKVSWEILINNILRAISDLNQAAKLDNKSVYISHTNQVVRAIRDMLASSGTVSRNSPIMHSNKLLRSHHHHIMSSLSKLVLTSKVASGLWPPPDAINKMRYQAGQVLLSIRHFVSIAQDVPLELRPISECSVDEFDIKGAELSDIEFVSRLDAYSESIIKSITALVQNVNAFEKQQTGMDIVPGVTSTTPSSSSFSQLVSQQQLIDHARNTVTEIGQFLSLIEEIKISNVLKSSESASFMGSDGHIYTNPSPSLQSTLKLLSDFKSKKELLYAVVNDLVTTARSTMDAFAPPDALQTLMDATTLSLKAVEDLCMAAKLVIDQEELLEQRLLAEESEQLTKTSKSSLRDSAESELGLLQRRAMSLTFLKSDGAGAGGDGGQGVSGARSGGEDQIRGGASGGNPYTSSESAPPVQQTISYSSKHLPATPGGSSSDHQQLQQQPTSPQQYQDYLQRYQQHRTSQPHQRTSSQETSGSGSTTPPSSGRANAYGSKNISMPPLPNSSSSKSRTSNSGDVLGSQQLSKLEKLIGEDQVRDFLNKPKEVRGSVCERAK